MACLCGGSHPANMPCQYHLEETERRLRESRGIGLIRDAFKPIELVKPVVFPVKKSPFDL